MRVPLAWLNLTHDRRRFVLSVAGITFAVLLMFMELGIWNALLDSVVQLIDRFNADLVIVSKAKYALHVTESFTRRRLESAGSVDGVMAVYPLYIGYGWPLWTRPEKEDLEEPATRPIRVLAFDPAAPVLLLPAVQKHKRQLELPDTILLDIKSKRSYFPRDQHVARELAQHKVRVVGNFSLGTDFASDGNLIMSADNLARFLSRGAADPLGQVQVGLVQVAPQADPALVKRRLRAALINDVTVLSREEFAQQERAFWQSSSPIGFVFSMGLVMGFVVGVIICYQILSADILDHLAEYATLKAIGYPNRFLTGLVLGQALWLALLGFLPGMVLAKLFYALLENMTGLPMLLTAARIGIVLILTVAMCLTSGLIAIRKVQAADPAEVF